MPYKAMSIENHGTVVNDQGPAPNRCPQVLETSSGAVRPGLIDLREAQCPHRSRLAADRSAIRVVVFGLVEVARVRPSRRGLSRYPQAQDGNDHCWNHPGEQHRSARCPRSGINDSHKKPAPAPNTMPTAWNEIAPVIHTPRFRAGITSLTHRGTQRILSTDGHALDQKRKTARDHTSHANADAIAR
jgi:hypothetical protein